MSLTKKYIYADNAATTQLDPEALEAMLPFLRGEFGNPSSPYSFSRIAKKALADARAQIAECIGALPEEIYFTSGGSESDNWAIKNFVFAQFHRKRQILISSIEHHAVLNSCVEAATRFGFTIISVPVDSAGKIILPIYQDHISEHIDGISIMLANNEIGTIEEISALVKIAQQYNIPFHTDAIQAMGHIPIDVKLLGIDLLSASAHKFNGPKGIGFQYIKKGFPITNFIDGGQQESGHRAGTENVASAIGMAVALQNNCTNMNENIKKLKQMERVFRDVILNELPSAIFNGDKQNRLPGHISLSIPQISGEALLHILDLKGIAVSIGAACNSQALEVSHVLKAISLPEELAKGTIRISFSHNNSVADPLIIAREIISYSRKVLNNRKIQ